MKARTSSFTTRKSAETAARRLFEDELVEFEIKEGPKGLQAVNVLRQDGGQDQPQQQQQAMA